MTVAAAGAEQEAHAAEGVTGVTAVAGRSPAQIAWSRLKRDKVGMISGIVVLLVVVIAVCAPLISHLVGVTPNATNTNLIGDGALPKLGPLHSGITAEHPLGVEPGTGRDTLSRLLYGARISLLVSLLGTVLTTVLGTFFGIVAGYGRGRLDSLLGYLMDLILSFPQLILLVALSPVIVQVFDRKLHVEGNAARISFLVIVFGVFGWPYLARIVRGQVLSLREREFVEAAVSMGAGTGRILGKEILPNLWVPILVYSSLLLPSYISAEAALSFLGVGVGEPTATWGKMLADSVTTRIVDPLYLFIPGVALFIVVLAFNLLGDSVRDALDPRAGRA